MEKNKSYLLGTRSNSRAVAERKFNTRIREQKKELWELNEAYQEREGDIKKLIGIVEDQSRQLENLQREKEEHAVVVRELMKIKWKEIDRKASETEQPNDIIECLICGYKAERISFETRIAECIFNGGRLERYVCSCCGGIFGPTKFSNLSQKEKDEDYYVHYLGFSENDATEKELRAFYMLNPKKEGIYLNYGCGNWSKSLQILQQEGYTVYGYEPYAKTDNFNQNLITEKSVLEKMRFDGIFSNDVIEHFVNPVEELLYMKRLLRDSEAKMAHSTSCYEYKHEETRFHTFFFTGDSLEYLCKKTGLQSCDYVNDLEQNDFICHVFKQKDFQVDYLPMMYTMGNAEKRENTVVLQPGAVLHGPYLKFSKGELKWHIKLDKRPENPVCVRITVDAGKKILGEFGVVDEDVCISCEVEQMEEQLEVVIINTTSHEIAVYEVKQY